MHVTQAGRPDLKPLTGFETIQLDHKLVGTFKTGLVYTKCKSGSISWHVQSKSGHAHVLDGLPPCERGQRSFSVQSFRCADKSYSKEAAKHNLG